MVNRCHKHSLFENQFFELFSIQVLIQYCVWIVHDAKFILFVVVVVINITVVILLSKTQGLGIAVEFECTNAIW